MKKNGQWKPSRKIKHLPCISRLVIPAHGDNLRIPWLLQEFCETRGGWGKNPSGFQCKPRQAPRLRWSVDRCRLVKMAAIVCKTCLNVCMQDFFNFRQWGRIIIHKKVKLLLVDKSYIQLNRLSHLGIRLSILVRGDKKGTLPPFHHLLGYMALSRSEGTRKVHCLRVKMVVITVLVGAARANWEK